MHGELDTPQALEDHKSMEDLFKDLVEMVTQLMPILMILDSVE